MTELDDRIDDLLTTYRGEPGFPFLDWTTNHHAFFRLINFWDQIFQLAAGRHAVEYKAEQEVTQDPFSPIYFVSNADGGKKICIWTGLTDDGQPDAAFFWGRYPDLDRPDPGGETYSSTLPDRYKLELACDFDATRVKACAQMIRAFTHADTSTAENQKLLESAFEAQFRDYFPLPKPEFGEDD